MYIRTMPKKKKLPVWAEPVEPPPPQKKPNRAAVLPPIRVTEGEAARIKELAAELCGGNVSEFIRRRALGEAITA